MILLKNDGLFSYNNSIVERWDDVCWKAIHGL